MKILYSTIMMLMVVTALSLTACGGDDDIVNESHNYTSKFSGTWKFSEINAQYGTSISSGWTPVIGDMFLQLNNNGSCTLRGKGTYRFQYGDNVMKDIILGDYNSWKLGSTNEKDVDGIMWLYYKDKDGKETFDPFFFKFHSNNEVIIREPMGLQNEFKLIRQSK